jgi:signal transduction histidine kinase
MGAMNLSLRTRLVAVTALAVIACAAALLSVLYLSRTSAQQRLERAQEFVEREVERLRNAPAPDARPGGPRFGRTSSGLLDESFAPTAGFAGPPALQSLRAAAARESARTRAVVLRTVEQARPGGLRRRARDDDEATQGTLVVAVAPRAQGGYAWAATWVMQPRGERLWRVGATVLSLATLALVVVALHTLLALRRGAAQLGDTLRALAGDLRTPVARPSVPELAGVSDGISSLAQALLREQASSAQLSRELGQRERLASLGRVAAGIAHEVRNPLASIKLRIDLSRQTVLLPHVDLAGIAADLSEAGDEIARLDRLVADLLVVSGRRMGPRRDTDLRALVDQRADYLDAMASERGVKLAVEGSARAAVDADSLVRVVDNLLRNAIEAAPEGSTVRASLTSREGAVTLAVSDRGAGVPAERERELFEPFFTTKNEGTGLGLALSRAVIEAHGGGLRYRRDGSVTVFEATLPG